jgi:DNA-binding transcriptional LysR family regulator
MELRHLRYYIAVAEELSFTRAAKKLRLAQPSLSRQIQNLEDELGVRLLDRDKVRVSLTEEGRAFLADATRLVEQSLESIRAVRRFSKGGSDRLNLGYSFKFNYVLLPATLATCYSDSPEIAVSLFDMTPAEQIEALEARKIDLGFVGLRPPVTGESSSNLNWECIARHDIVVVLPFNHALMNKSVVFMLDLKSEFFVIMSESTHPGSYEWLRGLCAEAGFTPRILQDVELESGIMNFVREGLGVTVASENIKRLPQRGIVFRPVANAGKAEFWIAWHRDNASKALAKYIEIVKEGAASHSHS